jgi:hypothetical protein
MMGFKMRCEMINIKLIEVSLALQQLDASEMKIMMAHFFDTGSAVTQQHINSAIRAEMLKLENKELEST